jgi:hypothetical protein
MKRDMDLVRKILIAFEAAPFPDGQDKLHIEGYEDEDVQFHMLLMREAGLVEAIDVSTQRAIQFLPRRLTWEGYEFLEAARDETNWNKAKKTLAEKAGGLVFSLLKELLITLAKEAVSGRLMP